MTLLDLADRLEFVPVTQLDAGSVEAVRIMRNDPRVAGFLLTDAPISPERHAGWIASLRDNPRACVFAVLLDGELAGTIGLSDIDPAHRRASWGFYVHPEKRGRGIASAMGLKFLDRVFVEHGIDKLNAEVLDNNDASLAMHRRYGFVEEGRRRRHILRGGRALDAILFGMTSEEWNAMRPAIVAASGE